MEQELHLTLIKKPSEFLAVSVEAFRLGESWVKVQHIFGVQYFCLGALQSAHAGSGSQECTAPDESAAQHFLHVPG